MTMPKRIQRKRTKGWRLPAGAKCVTRPGKYGNPFATAEEFRKALEVVMGRGEVRLTLGQLQHMQRIARDIHELRNLDLACFCGLDRDCHGDVLLEVANR